jgi:subtilisin
MSMHGTRQLSYLFVTAVALLFGAGAGGTAVSAPLGSTGSTGAYIVVLRDGTNPAVAARKFGVRPTFVYSDALSGYAAPLTAAQLRQILADPATVDVESDKTIQLSPPVATAAPATSTQQVSTAVSRVGALKSRTADIDGVDERIDVDVAVIDTGIKATHPDLNVVGGVNCSTSPGPSYEDGFGHGTFVAGLAAAIDNDYGVVGVAPGARLWSVRVMNDAGRARMSQIICGVDWVTAYADTIEVANMSLGTDRIPQSDACAGNAASSLHRAVCASVAAGVTYVVAAGNDSIDAGGIVPAAYPEVITVSAMADSDGEPGGRGPLVDCGQGFSEDDDTFAFFSNFGAVVDIAAPGVCVRSTSALSATGYAFNTGTSFSAPLAAGGAALYLASNPTATPAEVRQALIDSRERTAFVDDPDDFDEGVLNVRRF